MIFWYNDTMNNIKKELKGKLSEEKLQEIKKKIAESLSVDRQQLVCSFPFTGSISMRLDLKPVRDKRCQTACTDGKSVYFDCDFYSKLNPKERVFVLAHEIWHCVMLHLARKQSRQAQLFNIATDMEVNSLLIDAKNDDGETLTPPKHLCFPPKQMKGKSAEMIYEWLLKQAKKNNNTLPENCFGSPDGGDGEGDDDNSYGGKSYNRSYSSMSKNKSDKDEDEKEKNEAKGKGLSGQFDKHTYTDDDGDADNNNSVQDQWGEVGYDSDFAPNVSEEIAEEMREAVIAAAQECERQAGGLPGCLKGIIDKIIQPEISWKELLQQFVTQCYGGKRQWLPPARRHVWHEAYFQSRRNERIKVAVAVDTSGSCLGDIPKFFSELIGLLNTFGNYELTLIQNDYDISNVTVYDSDGNPFPDKPEEIHWEGGGGTSFKPPFEYIRKNGLTPDCFIFLTDGYEGFFDDEHCVNTEYSQPPYPVLWILTKDGNKDFCPWGKKIYFKESSYNY